MLKLITFVQSWMTARAEDPERGATMVEYGLLVVFIALVVAAAAKTLGIGVSTLFNDVNTKLAER